MPRLYVNVRFHGIVVDDKVCAVDDEVLLGDFDDAKSTFPGAKLRVVNRGGRLSVLGRTLNEGQQRTLRFGDVQVSLERVGAPFRAARHTLVPDVRLLVATAALILLSGFYDTMVNLHERRSTQLASAATASPGEHAKPHTVHGAGSPWRYGSGSSGKR